MKHLAPLSACLLLIALACSDAATSSVMKNTSTNALTAGFKTGANSLAVTSGGTLQYDAGASLAGDLAELRGDLGLGSLATKSAVASSDITDGTITNADINASAGIALSKLATTGTASSSTYLRGDGAWTAVSGGGITGPGSTADNALVRWDGTTGAAIQSSVATLSDAGAFAIDAASDFTGNTFDVKKGGTSRAYIRHDGLIHTNFGLETDAWYNGGGGIAVYIGALDGTGYNSPVSFGGLGIGGGAASWTRGSGSPEGSMTANPGSIYSRTSGGTGTSFYVKESGTGNTGWKGVTPLTLIDGIALLDFLALSPGGSHTLAITVTGADTGDCVLLRLPSSVGALGYITFEARVAYADTVLVTARHVGIAGDPVEDPDEDSFQVTVIKRD